MKILISALAASANLWRGLANVAGTLLISWPLFSSGLISCLDHSNVVGMWRNWTSTGIGVLDNTSKILKISRDHSPPIKPASQQTRRDLRKGYLAESVPIFVAGLNGPSAPHVFEFLKREDLGNLAPVTAIDF